MSKTINALRVHIGIYGRINSGKSSLFNALTNQNAAIVSSVGGTTTDPIKKTMEILPLGPVLLIDTAGIDDDSVLGEERIKKTLETINTIDIAILVVDANVGITLHEEKLMERFQNMAIPVITVFNKADEKKLKHNEPLNISVSCLTKSGISDLLNMIGQMNKKSEKSLVKDIVFPQDLVILVTPIDTAAPKGRIILPQQQVLRELLEIGALTIVVQHHELPSVFALMNKKPRLVITDSQVFASVAIVVPNDVYLTSFSILFARYKADLNKMIEGVNGLKTLKENDRVLILESCTHHKTCEDIGTVKIPRLLSKMNAKLLVDFANTKTIHDLDLRQYHVVIMCGSCMLNENEVKSVMSRLSEHQIPVINYGLFISYANGIMERALSIFR